MTFFPITSKNSASEPSKQYTTVNMCYLVSRWVRRYTITQTGRKKPMFVYNANADETPFTDKF
jgi:hypothetical protein